MPQRIRLVSLRARVAALAALVLGSAAQAGAPSLQGAELFTCSGLPCAELTVAPGKTVRMLLDTGNARSLLDKAAAERLGLTLAPYVGRDGKVHPEYSSATIQGARIGAATLGDLAVMVVNLAPSIAKGDLPAADGTLSYTAFAQRSLRIDYRRHRVAVSNLLTEAVPCPADCGTLTLPTFGAQGPPVVVTTGFSVNHKPVLVQVDTLYAGSMLIYPAAVDKLGLAAAQESKTLRRFPYTDGGVDMIEARVAAEGFGTKTLSRDAALYFATPDVHTPDGMFDGTVGQELFAGHVLTFDFFAHRFWMS